LRKVLGDAVGHRIFFVDPVYPLHISLGFLTGLLLNRYLRSKSAVFVWLLGAIPLGIDLHAVFELGGVGEVGRYVSLTNCDPCLDQFFALCPFYISVAYSIGAWIGLRHPTERCT
jgi:hypothetical protein